MGWETLAMVGFKAISSISAQNAAKAQAKAGVREAENNAMNTADKTVRAAGALRNSFLSNGIQLEGGPMDLIARAFAKGRTDVSRITENANAQSSNVVSAARTKMLQGLGGTIASAFSGESGGVIGDAFSTGISYLPDSFAYGLNDAGFGELGTNALIKSDTRAGLI